MPDETVADSQLESLNKAGEGLSVSAPNLIHRDELCLCEVDGANDTLPICTALFDEAMITG